VAAQLRYYYAVDPEHENLGNPRFVRLGAFWPTQKANAVSLGRDAKFVRLQKAASSLSVVIAFHVPAKGNCGHTQQKAHAGGSVREPPQGLRPGALSVRHALNNLPEVAVPYEAW
jgi:hypothetical protein